MVVRLNCQLGLSLVGGQLYDGFLYVRTTAATSLAVSLEDSITDAVLAVDMRVVDTQGQWQRINFTLTPAINTTCGADAATVLGIAQTVYGCSGRFVVALTDVGVLDVDYTYLSAGDWGLVNTPVSGSLGLPARADVAALLAQQQLKTIRIVRADACIALRGDDSSLMRHR